MVEHLDFISYAIGTLSKHGSFNLHTTFFVVSPHVISACRLYLCALQGAVLLTW